MFQTGKVDRRSLSATGFFRLLAVTLHTANSDFATFRPEVQRVAHVDIAAEHRTGHHRAVAGNRENTVNRHAKQRERFRQLDIAADFEQRFSKLVDTFAGLRRDGHDRAAFEECADKVVFNVAAGQLNHVFVDEVDLRQRDEANLNAQQIHNVEMLARLRHDRVVRRDDQHGNVDARRTGDHVSNKTLVARNIDNPNLKITGLEMRKPEVNRNPAGFFFRQTIRVNAGQLSDQPGLPVVNVPGRADDDRFLSIESRHEVTASQGGHRPPTNVLLVGSAHPTLSMIDSTITPSGTAEWLGKQILWTL